MLLFIPRSLCALKRIAAKAEHHRYGATQGIRIALASGMYRAEATDGRRAVVVQGVIGTEDPPWPGFRDLPDDACEAVVLPKDLERASKLGDEWVQSRFGVFGMATSGNDVYLGLGNDVINTRIVEGSFPNISKVIPKKRPLFTFRVDPKLLGETLLAMAELLPEESRAVQCFYYGDGLPIGFCARNGENGLMIDALVVPLIESNPKDKATEDRASDGEPQNGEEPKPSSRRRKKDESAPDANGQQQSEVAAPETEVQEPEVPDDPPTAQSEESNGQDGQEPTPAKKSKKVRV